MKCLAWISAVLLLCSCASQQVNVQIRSSEVLNQNAQLQSLPVTVHLYQLTSPDRFKQTDYWQLLDDEKEMLGESLVGKKTLVVNPRDDKTVLINLKKDVNYIGVQALFRTPVSTKWRSVIEMKKSLPGVPARLYLILNKNQIKLEQ